MSVGHEEIPDADHESLIERVCAVDVAKATDKVCLRVPHPAIEGRRVSRVWDVPATLAEVTELATRWLPNLDLSRNWQSMSVVNVKGALPQG